MCRQIWILLCNVYTFLVFISLKMSLGNSFAKGKNVQASRGRRQSPIQELWHFRLSSGMSVDLSPSKYCGENRVFFKNLKWSSSTFKMDTNDLNHHQSPIPTLWHIYLVIGIMVYMVDVINIAWKEGFLRYSLTGH